MPLSRLAWALAVCTGVLASLLFWTAPAGAIEVQVTNGSPVSASKYPWLGIMGRDNCGSTLVTPDRLVTAAHCVSDTPVRRLPTYSFGSPAQKRKVVRMQVGPEWVSVMHDDDSGPGDLNEVGGDLAILQLDKPVEGIAPVPLATLAQSQEVQRRGGVQLRVAGAGVFDPDEARISASKTLHQATVTVRSDANCRRAFRRLPDSTLASDFQPREQLCTQDGDFKAPYRSPCYGDSGGPLFQRGAGGSAVLFGIVSGGLACGTFKNDPAIYVDAAVFTSFIMNPTPLWAPKALSRPVVEGDARRGKVVRCGGVTYETPPDKIEYEWYGTADFVERSDDPTYRIRRGDVGNKLSCVVYAQNAGGDDETPMSKSVRVARG